MIMNDTEYRSTSAHLRRFEEALKNLRSAGGESPTKLQQLEIAAVSTQASDLRGELASYTASDHR